MRTACPSSILLAMAMMTASQLLCPADAFCAQWAPPPPPPPISGDGDVVATERFSDFARRRQNERAAGDGLFPRERASMTSADGGDGGVPVVSRTVRVPIVRGGAVREEEGEALDITVWEMERPSEMIDAWRSVEDSERGRTVTTGGTNVNGNGIGSDPFGVVAWPGSVIAARELVERCCRRSDGTDIEEGLENSTVLVIGAGTGVESQCAAMLGARKVIATDVNGLTLRLLNYGAKRAGLDEVIEARHFDLFSDAPLPECDVLIAADVMYDDRLAARLGTRIKEALTTERPAGSAPTRLIVADSQWFSGTDFLAGWDDDDDDDNDRASMGNWEGDDERRHVSRTNNPPLPSLRWESRILRGVRGSGSLIGGADQVCDAEARMISWGWDRE